MGEEITKAEKITLLKAVAENAENRKAYIESRAEVIEKNIRKENWARELFKEVDIPDNQEASFDLPPVSREDTAYVSNSDGEPIRTQVTGGTTFIIPCDWIEDERDFKMDDARNGRLDVAQQADDELANSFTNKENAAAFALLKSAAQDSGVSASGCTFSLINDGILAFNLNRKTYPNLRIRTVYISEKSARDIRDWATSNLSEVTKKEVQNLGVDQDKFRIPGFGFIFHKIPDTDLVGDDEVYMVDNEKFGRMPIKQALMTQEDPTAAASWRIGIMAREKVGFGVINPYAAVKLTIT